jgi:hypothetical protein
MVLRKRRYRDLKKVGIGGFLAKTRAPKTALNGKKEGPAEEDQKKRPTWRPKKNKILVQYPEYIQDSFFGKDFMASCPDRVDEEELLVDADQRRIAAQDDGTAVQLNWDALAALEEMKTREEAARKEKEKELADARAAAEAAAKQAAAKARLAQEQLDELKKAVAAAAGAGTAAGGTDSKDGGSGGLTLKEEDKAAMDEDDLMLPSDLFGDDILKCLTSGGDIDIDESALDEAETEGGAGEGGPDPEEGDGSGGGGNNMANNELEEGLRHMLGPDFNTKDMEEILSGFVESDKREAAVRIKSETDIKTEPGSDNFDAAGGSANDAVSNAETNAATDFIKQELISSSPATAEFAPSGELAGTGRLVVPGPAAGAQTTGGLGATPPMAPGPTPVFSDTPGGAVMGAPVRTLVAPVLQQQQLQPTSAQQQMTGIGGTMAGGQRVNASMLGPRPTMMTPSSAGIMTPSAAVMDSLTGSVQPSVAEQQQHLAVRLPTQAGMIPQQAAGMMQQQQQQHPGMMMQQQQQHLGMMQMQQQHRMQQPGMPGTQLNRMMMPGQQLQQQQQQQQTVLGQQVT